MSVYIPKPFGHDVGWLAIRTTDVEAAMAALDLAPAGETSWEEGLDAATARWDQVFVSPAVEDWVLVVGLWAEGTGDEKSLDELEERVMALSERFGEAQALASRQTVGYQHWMLARSGELVRVFAYVGEKREVLRDEGEPTPAEAKLPWVIHPDEQPEPNEEDVWRIAGQWSVDPSKLGSRTKAREAGHLAEPPRVIIEKKEETESEDVGLLQRAFNLLRQRLGV